MNGETPSDPLPQSEDDWTRAAQIARQIRNVVTDLQRSAKILPQSGRLAYRADIDGLRAVAVLAVTIYHVNKTLMPGGFVGVDVFFVISGFLITGMILKELDARTFSLAEFYRNRVKRIAPMMMVVSSLVFLASQVLLLPEDAQRASKSVFASMLSLANVYFWRSRDADYFAADSAELPMLHMWSLSVEEQFYLLWPLAILGLSRLGRLKLLVPIGALALIASVLFAQFYFPTDPSFVYYLLPSRAGELLTGAVLAALLFRRRLELSSSQANWSSAVGIALVAGSSFLLNERSTFPGFLSLPPTIGAALVILGGQFGNGIASRTLASRPLVAIGRISYSAYLWHWPLIAFYRYGFGKPTALAAAVLVISTLVLAAISYRLIEQPLRGVNGSARSVILRHFVVPAAALGAIALVFSYPRDFLETARSEHYQQELLALRNEAKPALAFARVCQRQRVETADLRNVECVTGDRAAATTALLWGDSNAAHYVGMLEVIANHSGFRFRNIEVGSCPPVLDDSKRFVPSNRYRDCEYTRQMIQPVLSEFQVIIVSASWSDYQSASSDFLDVFYRTATRLSEAGKLVIVIGKAPEWLGYDRRCREKALTFPFLACELGRIALPKAIDSVNTALRKFAENTPNIRYFDANMFLCPNGECSAIDPNGKDRLYDGSHLSMDASTELGNLIYQHGGVPGVFRQLGTWQAEP